MSYTAMTNRSAGDTIAEADWDAFQGNIEYLYTLSRQPRVIMLNFTGATTSASYTDVSASQITLTPANVASGAAVYLEVLLYTSSALYAAYAQLAVDGSAVTGSEVTTTSTSATLVRSGDVAAQLTGTSGVVFKLQIKNAAAGQTAAVTAARLIVEPN